MRLLINEIANNMSVISVSFIGAGDHVHQPAASN